MLNILWFDYPCLSIAEVAGKYDKKNSKGMRPKVAWNAHSYPIPNGAELPCSWDTNAL